MDVLSILVAVAVIGLIAWVIIYAVPMPEPLHRVVIAIAIIAAILVAFRGFGVTFPNFLR